jgi:hypothetical protein
MKKTGKNIECKHCKRLFYSAKWEINKGRKYCSDKCRAESITGKKHSKEHSKKISNSNKGRLFSKEHKKKLSLARMGIKLSDKTREKIRIATSGERSNFWKGGLKEKKYPVEWSDKLRDDIRKRDNYICLECGIHQEELKGWNKKLDVHHIDYNKDNCNENNLISLCRDCHLKTNFNREYWIKYFNNKLTKIIWSC